MILGPQQIRLLVHSDILQYGICITKSWNKDYVQWGKELLFRFLGVTCQNYPDYKTDKTFLLILPFCTKKKNHRDCLMCLWCFLALGPADPGWWLGFCAKEQDSRLLSYRIRTAFDTWNLLCGAVRTEHQIHIGKNLLGNNSHIEKKHSKNHILNISWIRSIV